MVGNRPAARRLGAALFIVFAVPAGLAVATAGGALALAPLALLVVSILALGRAPGMDTLQNARRRLGGGRPARTRSPRPARPAPVHSAPRTALGIANSLAERGPPLLSAVTS